MAQVFLYVIGALFSLVGIKASLGIHFPWEKCECCGKRWGDHKRPALYQKLKDKETNVNKEGD